MTESSEMSVSETANMCGINDVMMPIMISNTENMHATKIIVLSRHLLRLLLKTNICGMFSIIVAINAMRFKLASERVASV